LAKRSGKVSAGPLGKDLSINNGEFNTFPGEEGSDLKHITYRFGFTSADNEPCYFSGIKNIHIDPKQRSRHEPATLYSRVYKGESEGGKLIGSGILLFRVLRDAPGLFFSLRTIGAQSFSEKIQALKLLGTGL